MVKQATKHKKKKYKVLILDKEIVSLVLTTASNLTEVRLRLVRVLEETRRNHVSGRLGYVSGIITSDGDKKILENINRLENYTNDIRKIQKFPIFSPTDIPNDVYARLQEMKLPRKEREEKFILFWREILTSGHVTDIFMTPRWRESRGAQDEHKTAIKVGIEIHYVNI